MTGSKFEFSYFVFSLILCFPVSCLDNLLIHISVLIRKLEQKENLKCKIFSAKNVKRPVLEFPINSSAAIKRGCKNLWNNFILIAWLNQLVHSHLILSGFLQNSRTSCAVYLSILWCMVWSQRFFENFHPHNCSHFRSVFANMTKLDQYRDFGSSFCVWNFF